jgi:hypothetical protein
MKNEENAGLEMVLESADSQGIGREQFVWDVQKMYFVLLKKEDYGGFHRLRKMTGIQPVLPVEFVQERYKKSVEARGEDFDHLRTLTGVEPAQEVLTAIRDKYHEILTKEKYYQLNQLVSLSRQTGVGIPNNVVEQAYLSHIQLAREIGTHLLENLKEAREFTGVPLPKDSIEEVQEEYRAIMIGKKESYEVQERHGTITVKERPSIGNALHSLTKWKEATGVPLPKDVERVFQEVYIGEISQGRLENFVNIWERVDVEPSEQVYSAVVRALSDLDTQKAIAEKGVLWIEIALRKKHNTKAGA